MATKKKAPAKRSAPVKKGSKKAAPKKAVKKAAPKKAVAKKPVAKRSVTAKPAAKKSVVKKAAPKKTAPSKKITKPVSERAVSKPEAPAKTKPVSAASAPAMAELSEEMHEKAVHNEKETQSMLKTGGGAKALERKEDPIMAFDMHMAQKATSKGDRNNKLRISSTGQRPIRPSGKMPLW